MVPHVAMMTAVANKTASHNLQRPVKATFADTGPMTQRRNAENDPRKAIIELNSGTRMEATTETMVNIARSTVVKNFLRPWRRLCANDDALSSEFDFAAAP